MKSARPDPMHDIQLFILGHLALVAVAVLGSL